MAHISAWGARADIRRLYEIGSGDPRMAAAGKRGSLHTRTRAREAATPRASCRRSPPCSPGLTAPSAGVRVLRAVGPAQRLPLPVRALGAGRKALGRADLQLIPAARAAVGTTRDVTAGRYGVGHGSLLSVRGLVRVLCGRQLQRSVEDGAEVTLLDRDGPVGQLGHLGDPRALVELADDHPVADLARLGHREELEPVERVVLAGEVGLHHLGRLALDLPGLLDDRRLLSVERAGDRDAALLGRRGLVVHARERRDELGAVVVE